MSLINDALKKAQKQRTGEAPPLASMPSVGGQSAAQISRRAKPAGFNTLMVRAGIGGAVVLVLAVGGWLALRQKPETGNLKPEGSHQVGRVVPNAPSASEPGGLGTNRPTAQPIAVPSVGQPPATSNQQPAPVTAPVFTLPTAPKEDPVAAKVEPPNPQASGLSASVSPAPNPQVSGFRSQVSEPAKPAPSPAAKLDPRAMTFIENIKVAGIRASATDSKVLMNDRVYRLGDIVEHEMGLKLAGITSNSLTFEDEKGARYTRTF